MTLPDTSNAHEPTGLFDLADLTAEIRMGHSWIYSEMKAGRFPRPIKLGRASRWRRSDIAAWLVNAANDNFGGEA